MARALGARDVALGVIGCSRYSTVTGGERTGGAQAAADIVDLVAVLVVERPLGRLTRAVAGTMATGSAGIAGDVRVAPAR
jgi:hypothetical protein